MKKTYALVSLVEPLGANNPKLQGYRTLIMSKLHRSNMPETKGQQLGENVWLLDRTGDVSILAKIVSAAEDFGVEYSVRFLSED